jgi:hypothetical protein
MSTGPPSKHDMFICQFALRPSLPVHEKLVPGYLEASDAFTTCHENNIKVWFDNFLLGFWAVLGLGFKVPNS